MTLTGLERRYYEGTLTEPTLAQDSLLNNLETGKQTLSSGSSYYPLNPVSTGNVVRPSDVGKIYGE